jgi:hypothetical protein
MGIGKDGFIAVAPSAPPTSSRGIIIIIIINACSQKGLITKCKYCMKLSSSRLNGWDKYDSIFGACANGSIGRAFQKDMYDIFNTLVGETWPVATKLMVYLAKNAMYVVYGCVCQVQRQHMH